MVKQVAYLQGTRLTTLSITGNVHFLSLDSYGKEDTGTTRLYDTLGAQVQWIKADLAANKNKGWVVAYWHHPPYTMGSHNSDNETELVKIRENFLQVLERLGVDLVLCGHSHDYERSKLMNGHYGKEGTFDSTVHNLSQSSGLYDGSSNSCPYVKDTSMEFSGTLYVVSGSAGQLGGSQAGYPHNALAAYSNATNGGAMMLEAQGNRLDAKWICADGQIRDHFTMMKRPNFHKEYTINEGDSVELTAGFFGDHSWNDASLSGRKVLVHPKDTTMYTVRDSFSCVVDSFTVNVIPKTNVGITSIGLMPEVIVAPNPSRTSDMCIYLSSGRPVSAQLTLTDVSGRSLFNRTVTLDRKPQTFLPSLEPGLYVLSIEAAGQRTSRKLVIH
jgi:hypothetical protein